MHKSGAGGQVDKRDPYRVLLTEVLPYEVPLWFTNEFFHDECTKARHQDASTPLGYLLSIVGEADLVPLFLLGDSQRGEHAGTCSDASKRAARCGRFLREV